MSSDSRVTTFSERIRALATPRHVVDGKVILDPDDPLDREWFEDDGVLPDDDD